MDNKDLSHAQLVERIERLEAYTKVVQRFFDRDEELEKLRKENAELRNKLGEARQQFADEQSKRLLAEAERDNRVAALRLPDKDRGALQEERDRYCRALELIWSNFRVLASKKARLSESELNIYLALRALPGVLGGGAMAWSDDNESYCIPSVKRSFKAHADKTHLGEPGAI